MLLQWLQTGQKRSACRADSPDAGAGRTRCRPIRARIAAATRSPREKSNLPTRPDASPRSALLASSATRCLSRELGRMRSSRTVARRRASRASPALPSPSYESAKASSEALCTGRKVQFFRQLQPLPRRRPRTFKIALSDEYVRFRRQGRYPVTFDAELVLDLKSRVYTLQRFVETVLGPQDGRDVCEGDGLRSSVAHLALKRQCLIQCF